ncbi:hypothetical protein E0Z10_g1066 [Xylaria hypoxylon]|uniref:Rhodopsin domain-containing protein n=1 Tax=Xylaria hypoxylon TaxID=37992 RepID=A0A4Z0YTN1_9PEZI|nr:hypothetical protein E0Z10_g1066 [Xylaria hypoxylon]
MYPYPNLYLMFHDRPPSEGLLSTKALVIFPSTSPSNRVVGLRHRDIEEPISSFDLTTDTPRPSIITNIIIIIIIMSGIDLNAPALDAPPGVKAEFDNPPNHNGAVIAIYTVSIFLTTVFVLIRLYAKFHFLKAPRLEDYLLIPTFGVYLAHCVFWLMMIHTTGHFVHIWNFRIGGLAPFYRNGFYATILYESIMLAIKPMILLEWMRIFASAGPRTAFNWTCYIVAAINILLYLGSILTDSVSCHPREYWWDQTIVGGHCADTKKLPIVTGTLNAIIDLFILLLPQGIIWRLQMSTRKRLGVSIVFLVGTISVAAAITRTVLSFSYADSDDVTYNFSLAGTFTLIEMTAAIIVFAAPTVPKPTYHLVKVAGSSVGRLIGSNRSGSGTYASKTTASKPNAYYSIHEQGKDSAVMMKLRSSRSKGSGRPSTGQDSELELALPERTTRYALA